MKSIFLKASNRTWTNESTNLTYFDGSITFEIYFAVSGLKQVNATLIPGLPSIKNASRTTSQSKIIYGYFYIYQRLKYSQRFSLFFLNLISKYISHSIKDTFIQDYYCDKYNLFVGESVKCYMLVESVRNMTNVTFYDFDLGSTYNKMQNNILLNKSSVFILTFHSLYYL